MIGRMMYLYAYIERSESVTQECEIINTPQFAERFLSLSQKQQ